jgi:septation ring formation regulator EzrA
MPVEMVRKVKQPDNDVQAIYEMLAEIAATQRRHSNRFTELDDKLIELANQVTELTNQVTQADSKLDTILSLLGSTQPTNGK